MENTTPTPEQQKEIMAHAEIFDASIDPTLKDIAHWLGGWDELRKKLDELEENEKEAAFERWSERRYSIDG